MREKWVDNHGVLLQYLYHGDLDSGLVPLFITPGVTETAEDYIWLMKKLNPRPSAVITFRGRGKSGLPKEGYTLYDHIQDMEAVLEDLGFGEFILYGYNRGVSYALGYSLNNLGKIRGLILGDYPAVHTELPEKWLENFTFSRFPEKGMKREKPRMTYKAARALQKDSHEVIFWEALQSFTFPVVILQGGGASTFLTRQDMRKYLWYLSDCRIYQVKSPGEDWNRNNHSFAEVIGSCCLLLDDKIHNGLE